jgi:WD40 repeat protein
VTPFTRIETGMHIAGITLIDVDAAERFLVSGSFDKTVRVWDLATGTLLQTLRVPMDESNVGKIYAVALSPDGSTVAVGGFMTRSNAKEEVLYLFDRESGALRRRIGGLNDVAFHLTFSRDGRHLAATLGDKGGFRSMKPPAGSRFLRIALTAARPTAPISRRTADW